MTETALQPLEEVLVDRERHPDHLGSGQHRSVDMDRIARLRNQRHVPRLDQGPHQMRQPLLGPDGVDDLGFRIDVDTKPSPVAIGHRLPQVGNTPRRRVPVIAGIAGSFRQLVDHLRLGGDVRVAESEIDDVFAGPTRLQLKVVDLGEDVRG